MRDELSPSQAARGSGPRRAPSSAGSRAVGSRRGASAGVGVSRVTRLTRSWGGTGAGGSTAAADPTGRPAHPDPLHREPRRDRRAHHADLRAARDPCGRPGDRSARTRSTCSTSRPSSTRRGRRRRRRSTRASGSSPRTRTSRRPSSRPGSAGSARRRRRSGRWATRPPPGASPPRSASRSCPATTSADQSDDALVAAAGADRLSAAGQARGRRRRQGDAHRPRARVALLDAIGAARREAAAAFGDDRLILERLVVGARHVEIQVLFDGHGERHPPRRARLLDPAAPPEDPRGDAVARGRRRAARAARARPP